MLGRYFMDQLPCIAAGRFPAAKGSEVPDYTPPDPFYPPSGGIYLPRAVGTDGRAASDYAFQATIGRIPTASDNPALFSFFGYGQMLPHADNRITLNKRRRDAWGLPVPHIRCAMHAPERALLARQTKALRDIVDAAGGQFDFIGSPMGLTEMGRGAYPDSGPISRFLFRHMFTKSMAMGAAIHESGGARMGVSPNDSVQNEWGQSWDVPNLFVTDAAAFPGSGVSGTTLTLMAQTIRACRYLADEYRRGLI